MQTFKKRLLWLLGTIVFALGLLILFPMWIIQSRLSEFVQKQSGYQIVSREMALGTGLGLGLAKGSILALRAKDFMVRSPDGRSLVCRNLTVAPQVWALVTTELKTTIACQMNDSSELMLQLSAKPFWDQKSVTIEGFLEKVPIAMIADFLNFGSYMGNLNGSFTAELDLQKSVLAPVVSWDIEGEEIQVPSLNAVVMTFPSMSIGGLKTQGEYTGSKIRLKPLKFGGKDTPMEGDIHVDFGLDERGLPVSGLLEGSLKIDPEFEATQLKDLDWNMMFGKPGSDGYRRFKKPIKGSVMSLLNIGTQ